MEALPPDLARQAITHASWTEQRSDSYERLAFLGDVVLSLAVAAGLAVKLPALFGLPLSPDAEVPSFYFRNASLFVFPLLAIYFAWKALRLRELLANLALFIWAARVPVVVVPEQPRTGEHPRIGLLDEILGVLARPGERRHAVSAYRVRAAPAQAGRCSSPSRN